MKTLNDVLRESDPVTTEVPSAHARAATRSAILAGPRQHYYDRKSFPRRRVLAYAAVTAAAVAAAVFGWRHASVDVAAMQFEARIAESNQTILVTSDIQTAKVVALHDRNKDGQTKSTVGVELTFTPEGAEKMRRATSEHVGEHLQLIIDHQVVMAPLIRAPTSSEAMLTGDFTYEQANRIIDGLMKGKLELLNTK